MHNLPKKARSEATNPNPGDVLCNIPVLAPVVTSLSEMPLRLTGKSLEITDSPVDHAECEVEVDMGHCVGETVNSEAGNETAGFQE
jgi:hypothetical protein